MTLVQRSAERLLTTSEESPIALDESPHVTVRRLVTNLVEDSLRAGPMAYVAWNEVRSLTPETRAWITRLWRLCAAEWVHVLSRIRADRADVELMAMVNGVHGMVIETTNLDVDLEPGRV